MICLDVMLKRELDKHVHVVVYLLLILCLAELNEESVRVWLG